MNLFKSIFMMGLFSSLFGCSGDQGDSKKTEQQAPLTKPVEHIEATPDQRQRRERSEAYCREKNIPVYKNANALFSESEEKVAIRTKDEVVNRALALCYLGVKSEGLEEKHLKELDKKYGISAKFSPKEKAYAEAANPAEQDKVDANWRYESLHVMLWALGFIDSLSYPSQLCNVGDDVQHIFKRTEKEFRENAKLRTKKEILDQADLILRLDWACVSARVKGEPAPGGLDKSVVYERHYSLNWLIKYLNQDWDEVRTDT